MLRRMLFSAGRVIRGAWMIVGATLVLIVVLEGAYRTQAALRRVVSRPAAEKDAEPPSPFDTTKWAADYWIGHQKEEAVQWAPYVYIRNPTFQAPFATVDSLGHRITPLPESHGGRPFRIFFLGGSTIFGWYQRAEHTIPAEVARRVQALLGDSAHVEVTNFGVPGYTFTQETLELYLQLRNGARPDVVVFYDGINDVLATVQNERAGLPQNESNRKDDFERGRRLAARSGPGFGNDLRAVGEMLSVALARMQIAQRIVALKRPAAPEPASTDSLARDMVRTYTENARVVEALAEKYGFHVIYVWQPTIHSTRKPMTKRETWMHRQTRPTALHMAIPPLISAAMAPVAGSRFIDATTIFDNDSLEVYVDVIGHTYERANPRIVDTLMPNLRAAVHGAMSRTRNDRR